MTRLRQLCAFLFVGAVSPAGAQAVDTPGCSVRQATPMLGNSLIPRDSATSGRAAVVILAEATAGEVTFAKQPELRVRLCGGLDSVRVVERRNLPNPVVVGRTYRDVYVAVEIFGRLDAECITAALRSTGADSTGRRNACVGLDLTSSTGRRPPES